MKLTARTEARRSRSRIGIRFRRRISFSAQFLLTLCAFAPDVRAAEAPSAGSGGGAADIADWNFTQHIQPVLFKTGCNTGACHGAAAGKNGFRLSLRGFDHDADHAALTREASGRRVSLAEPEESLILLKATQAVPHGGGERFTADSVEYRRILEWIRAGARPASPDDPRVTRIETLPAEMNLTTGGEETVRVLAHYTDGTSEDVSRWVKYGTTDESVATVDDDGRVTVQGPGAAAITVWYASKVSFARLAVPRGKPVDARVFADAPRNNFIDDLNLDQLEKLAIPPAGPASDSDFIRRAWLDCVGVLPDPREVLMFGMDESPDKRARLIDRLLASDEFTDYWTYKWSDLFLLSSRKLPNRPELMAFHRFIRESVASNLPWDEFARRIVTAKGSSFENGATNYYVMHKDPIDLAETTSQAFLGMSVTCARCHNHPLEKWTQDQYYGFANLFSRVKIKNGAPGRETRVLVSDFGELIHPRTGRPMPPTPLDGEPLSADGPADRREHLADWLTSPDNPYFTRAVVNRVWRNFMGRGLVEAEDDLRLTNPPTNEPLLAALERDLVGHDFDLRHLVRVIMNSAAYQRDSAPPDPDAPDEKYYSHYIVRRLSAEVILDAYSSVTGVPTSFPGYPAGWRALQLPDSRVGSYFLDAFGRPERNQTCSCERTSATSVAQTLHVANGDTLNAKLRDDRSVARALAAGPKSNEEALNELYLRALARLPHGEEKRRALEILDAAPADTEMPEKARREAIEDVAWALLSGKEFLFNH